MVERAKLTFYDQVLRPNPARTVVRPFEPGYPENYSSDTSRTHEIIEDILALPSDERDRQLKGVTASLDENHRDVDAMLRRRFDEMVDRVPDAGHVNDEQRRLIGAYFSQEYAYEAAALFNPSIVMQPLPSDAVMFRAALGLATSALGAAQPGVAQAARSASDPLETAYVLMGEDGRAVARAVTTAKACPSLTVDGRALPMNVHAGAANLPLRPTASTPANSKPSEFPVTVCDASLPSGTRRAMVNGRPLPVPKPTVRRIVVIGDTGCRLKASENAYQACNDPAAYPFATVAAHAAAWRPDLVIHVGDYLYRENPCAPGASGCAGSPWDYGWDSWQADFFKPGALLLAAAPWAVTRGNHESCDRAGQGWWRLLDPRPLAPHRDCDAAADDDTGDYSPPYRVPLGKGAQVVVMDLFHAGKKKIEPDDPRYAQFIATHDALARYARNATFTFATDHYPILGVTIPDGEPDKPPKAGNKAFRSTFGEVDTALVPAGVDVLLAGHVHLWEHVDDSGSTPSQFITGFSGTQEDAVPLPPKLPNGISPLPGVTIRQFDAWTHGFGYMTMERTGAHRWKVAVRHADGRLLRRCAINGRHSICGPVED